MPTLFFENTDPHQKIRFDTFGHSKTMKSVRTKAIHDIRFLTPPNADFDDPRPAQWAREEEHYGANNVAPREFTEPEKAFIRSAMTLAIKIIDDGYEAMYNYLRFKKDPDNAHVLKFRMRMKQWLGINDAEDIDYVTSAMRKMQDKIQDPETFITFVNMEYQRRIKCKMFGNELYRPDLPGAPVYKITEFTDYDIQLPSQYSGWGRVWSGEGWGGMGIRMYLANVGDYNINTWASTIVHELSHKILNTVDNVYNCLPIYGTTSCKVIVDERPELAVDIASNWQYFYMSFGCYPDQEEYEYQAEYEIKDPQQANKSRLEKERQKNNIFEPSNTCVTFEDLEILDARNELL